MSKNKTSVTEEALAFSSGRKPAKNKKKLIILISIVCAAVIIAAVLIILLVPKNQDADGDADADLPVAEEITVNNYYNGVVEPQQTLNISKDPTRAVKEVYVAVGDIVKKGAKLFAYETSDISEKLQSAKLELTSQQNEIDRLANEIAKLTNDRAQAKTESDQLDLTAQLQTTQAQKERAELELKKKQAEIETLNNNLNNSVVTANISGIVNYVGTSAPSSAFDDSNADLSGTESSGAFITLLMDGTFRVKGTVDEMNVSSLSEGMNVTVHSRVDDTRTWTGTISKIETGNPSNNNNQSGSQSGESATKYTFYVNLISSDGLLLGQHVYIEEGIRFDDADADNAGTVAETSAEAVN